jgi:hypothetical protein
LAFTLGAITPTTVNGLVLSLGVNSLSTNVALGHGVLDGANSGSAQNTGIGYNALSAITTGQSNVGVGVEALYTVSTGSWNTALGVVAGLVTLGSNNVFLGAFAGKYETSGSSFYLDSFDRTDIAGGKAGALLYGTFNATPASQTLKVNGTLSVLSGIVPVTNDGMAIGTTALGVSDLFLASGGVINWDNGNMTLTHSAGQLAIGTGDFAVNATQLFVDQSTAFVGIGTNSPQQKLHVHGSNGLIAARLGGDTTYYLDIGYNITTEKGYIQAVAGAGPVYDDIQINPLGGDVSFGSGAITMGNLAGTGSRAVLADANGLLSAPVSDAEKKKDFTFIEESTAMAMLGDSGIRALTYRWRDKTKGDDIELGFTAQQFWPWKDEVKGLVFEDNGVKGLNYDRLTTLLWTQNKALLSKINDLENRVKMLESK